MWWWVMTQMTRAAELRREEIENALAILARARILLRTQVAIRLQQGCDRGMGDLLGPVIQYAADIDDAVECARKLLGDVWRNGELYRWGDPPPVRNIQ